VVKGFGRLLTAFLSVERMLFFAFFLQILQPEDHYKITCIIIQYFSENILRFVV